MTLHRYIDKDGKECFDAKELFDTIREGDRICFNAMFKSIFIVLPIIYVRTNYVIPWFKEVIK
jgi:hypothetical protein